jgi:hypothetical protein
MKKMTFDELLEGLKSNKLTEKSIEKIRKEAIDEFWWKSGLSDLYQWKNLQDMTKKQANYVKRVGAQNFVMNHFEQDQKDYAAKDPRLMDYFHIRIADLAMKLGLTEKAYEHYMISGSAWSYYRAAKIKLEQGKAEDCARLVAKASYRWEEEGELENAFKAAKEAGLEERVEAIREKFAAKIKTKQYDDYVSLKCDGDTALTMGLNEPARKLYEQAIQMCESKNDVLGAVHIAERTGMKEKLKELYTKASEYIEKYGKEMFILDRDEDNIEKALKYAIKAGVKSRIKELALKGIKELEMQRDRQQESCGASHDFFGYFPHAYSYAYYHVKAGLTKKSQELCREYMNVWAGAFDFALKFAKLGKFTEEIDFYENLSSMWHPRKPRYKRKA